MKSLSREDLERFIIETASHGKGSLDYIRTSIQISKGEYSDPDPNTDTPEYCKCGNCRKMPSDIEDKCCGLQNCLRNDRLFKKLCTDVDILQQSIRERCDIRAEQIDYSSNSLRKSAYRGFVLWRYGKLGIGNRRVVPSCCVLAIRKEFPSDNGLYMGFHER